MKFIFKVYGEIEYEENNIIIFNKGILGFEGLKIFIFVDLKDYELFKLL